MLNAIRLINRTADRVGPDWRPLVAFLSRNTPTNRFMLADDDMRDAVNATRIPAIDVAWDRFEHVQGFLGPRYMENRHTALLLPYTCVSYTICGSYGLAAGFAAGVKACLAAVRLFCLGRPDEARQRIKDNAFEVFCAVRLCEEIVGWVIAIELSYLFFCVVRRVIISSGALPQAWLNP